MHHVKVDHKCQVKAPTTPSPNVVLLDAAASSAAERIHPVLSKNTATGEEEVGAHLTKVDCVPPERQTSSDNTLTEALGFSSAPSEEGCAPPITKSSEIIDFEARIEIIDVDALKTPSKAMSSASGVDETNETTVEKAKPRKRRRELGTYNLGPRGGAYSFILPERA